MFNYQELYNYKKSEYFNSVANTEEANAVLEEEIKYLAKVEPWKYANDHLVERAKVATIFQVMKSEVMIKHIDMYKARIPWSTLDSYYEKALIDAYKESNDLDFNKVSGNYYNLVLNHTS